MQLQGHMAGRYLELYTSLVDVTHVTIGLNKPALYTKNKQTNVKHITVLAEPQQAN